MPIDYLSRKKLAEQEASNLVADRSIEDELDALSTGATKTQTQFLTDVGISEQEIQRRNPEIISKTKGIVDRQRLDAERKQYELAFNRAFNLAQDSGLDVESATQYARKITEQGEGQRFEAEESAKDRTSRQRISDIGDKYDTDVQGLMNQYQPDFDYAGALARVLTGVGSAYVTQRYLNKPKKTLSVDNQNPAIYPQRPMAGQGGSFEDQYDKYYQEEPQYGNRNLRRQVI